MPLNWLLIKLNLIMQVVVYNHSLVVLLIFIFESTIICLLSVIQSHTEFFLPTIEHGIMSGEDKIVNSITADESGTL